MRCETEFYDDDGHPVRLSLKTFTHMSSSGSSSGTASASKTWLGSTSSMLVPLATDARGHDWRAFAFGSCTVSIEGRAALALQPTGVFEDRRDQEG